MKGAWIICRREFAALFFGPLAWVLLCAALLLNGFVFTLFMREASGDVSLALSLTLGGSGAVPFWSIMAVLPPLLTMKMISEEAKTGMLEYLLTAPVTDLAVVLGKLLAATGFMVLLWSVVLVYAVTVQGLGTSPDWIPLFGSLLGAALTSALFCAIGLVASAGTNTPILAAFLAFIMNVLVLMLPFLGSLAGARAGDWVGQVTRHVNVLARLNGSFANGVLDTAHVAFFFAWIAFFVFLATRLLESRRWR